MIAMKQLLSFCIVCLAVSACATGYEEAESTVPHANFIFEKSVSSKLLFRGIEPSIVTYQVYKDKKCREPVPAANFSAISKEEKTMRFNANTPHRMVVNMVYKTGNISVVNGTVITTGPIKQENCIGVAKFTPEENQSYRLSAGPTENPEICVLNIINTATGKAPESLVQTQPEVCR